MNPEGSGIETVEEFEHLFSEFIWSKYAIAVSSGTMADTIALAVLKILNPDRNEVLVPALTFIAQPNSIIYNNLKPVFYDTEYRVNDKTLAVFPVHLLGVPTHINEESIPVVEDACEALGSKWGKKYCGTFGDMGTFSFYSSHTLSTGEGGMIVTDNGEYAQLARQLRNHGSCSSSSVLDKFHFDFLGFNGKMSVDAAKRGIAGMRTLHVVLKKRRWNYQVYDGEEEEGVEVVPHGFPVFYKNEKERDAKMMFLASKGVDSRKLFSCIPIHEKPYAYLKHKKGDFPISEKKAETGLYLPCHYLLTGLKIQWIKTLL